MPSSCYAIGYTERCSKAKGAKILLILTERRPRSMLFNGWDGSLTFHCRVCNAHFILGLFNVAIYLTSCWFVSKYIICVLATVSI